MAAPLGEIIRDSSDLLGCIQLHGVTPPSVRGGTISFERIESQWPSVAFLWERVTPFV